MQTFTDDTQAKRKQALEQHSLAMRAIQEEAAAQAAREARQQAAQEQHTPALQQRNQEAQELRTAFHKP